ncbi:MAG: hypothetical protein AB1486_08470 [Planctomycetota bacterium]
MIVIELKAESYDGRGRRLVRVLNEQVVPAIPPAFLESLAAIQLVDPATGVRSTGPEREVRSTETKKEVQSTGFKDDAQSAAFRRELLDTESRAVEPGGGSRAMAPGTPSRSARRGGAGAGGGGAGGGGRSFGRLVRTGDGDFEVELYPREIFCGVWGPLLRSDVFVGACLAHALLPLLVQAREQRRHGAAGREACDVLGERLAQETLARAYGGRFLFRALEPVLLEAGTCRRAMLPALFGIPSALLRRLVQRRVAVLLMLADLVYRAILVRSTSLAVELDPLAPEAAAIETRATVFGVLCSGAALLLAVHLGIDLYRGLRTRFKEELPLGPIFAALWPAAVISSFLFLDARLRPSLAHVLAVAYAYLLLAYLHWFLEAAAALSFRRLRSRKPSPEPWP